MTDFLSRLVEQGSGRLPGIRPLIPPFFAPTTSRPAQTILWSYLSTPSTTISPALASNEAMFPPEQPENFSMPADLVPEHLRQVPLPSPLIRNLLAAQEVVWPDNDEIAQNSFPEEEGDFGGSDLNTIEGENVNLWRENIPGAYDLKEVAIRYQMPPSSADLALDSARHQLASSTNDQHLRRSASDSGRTQSSPDHGSHPNPIERLDVARGEDQLAMVVPTTVDGGTLMEELSEDEYNPEARLKITHMENQSVYHSPQPLPRSGDPIPESRRAQAGLFDGSRPSAVEHLTQEKLPIDSVRNDPTLTPRLQSLPPSGTQASDSIVHLQEHLQRKDRIDDIPDLRATVISPQPSPLLDASTPESRSTLADPAPAMQHLGTLTPESRRAQAGPSAEAHHAPEKFTPESAPTDSIHNDTALPSRPQPLSLSGALAPDSVVLQKKGHIDGIPDPRPTATSPQLLPRPDDSIPESRRNQADSPSGTQPPGISTSDGHTTRRRFRIDGVRLARETPASVDEHDTTVTPVLPTVQQHTIVPLIEDEAKQKSAIQQPAVVESPPPVIHIRIGRVEVRAATPESAPTSKPVRASRPGLTLSEYMQQRKEHLQ